MSAPASLSINDTLHHWLWARNRFRRCSKTFPPISTVGATETEKSSYHYLSQNATTHTNSVRNQEAVKSGQKRPDSGKGGCDRKSRRAGKEKGQRPKRISGFGSKNPSRVSLIDSGQPDH